MGAKIAELTEELQRQEDGFRRAVEAQAKEQKALIEQITKAVQRNQASEGPKLPRFVPPKQFTTPRSTPRSPPAFSIDITQSLERAEIPAFAGFPTPSLDSPAKSRATVENSLELRSYPDCMKKRARPLEPRNPNAKRTKQDLPAPPPRRPSARPETSFNFPSGSSNRQPGQLYYGSDPSMDSKAFFSAIGLQFELPNGV
jgi:hypothetical protein